MPLFSPTAGPLDRARAKAYFALLPLLFLSYAVAYVDRINVSLAALKMRKDLQGFDNAVVAFGAGVFFIGYFILEIPGTLLVERWSARKWISRIMISWGIVAALTAFIHYRVPGITHVIELAIAGAASWFESIARSDHGWLSRRSASIVAWLKEPGRPFVVQFFSVRFLLGLAEAGFFPGVIVYLSHWFPARDRARALSWFFIATPVAQIISPKPTSFLLRIGTTETVGDATVHFPALLGMQGWQWMYIVWGIPAVVLGFIVLFKLPDWPRDARWLEPDEREALEEELRKEKVKAHRHMRFSEALRHPKVLLLAAAYFFVVSTSYGVEFFLPSILEKWYALNLSSLTWVVIIPPLGGLAGQLFVGWSSDRTGERRLHASMPIYLGAIALWGALDPRLALVQSAARAGHGLVHRGAYRSEGVHAGVLGAAESAARRIGGRRQHRLDQFRRQPGRIRGAVCAGLLRDPDRFLCARPGVSLRFDDDLGHDHLDPGPGRPRQQPGKTG